MTILDPIDITGKVEAILVNPDAKDDSIETFSTGDVEVTFAGITGERHSGLTSTSDVRYIKQYEKGTRIRNTRQISIVCRNELQMIADALGIPGVKPEWLGANLVLAGLPQLTLLPPSTRLIFSSGAALVIDNENQACRYPAAMIDRHHPGAGSRFVAVAKNRRGLVAWVEREGHIRIADQVNVHIPPQRIYDPHP